MDRKKYLGDYYRANSEEIKRKRRERYALQKRTGFGQADKSFEKTTDKDYELRAKNLAKKVLKEKLRKYPDNLVVVTNWWEEPCNRVVIPAESVIKGCTVAVFNSLLTLVGFVDNSRLKPYYQGKIKDLYNSHYEVPVSELRWFDCSE